MEYDAQQRVTKEIVSGGSLSYTFSYEERQPGYTYGYNTWTNKTTESRPDGTQAIVFTNHVGQVLLRELTSGSGRWLEHWQYDEDQAHNVLHAHPSAVSDYELEAGTNDLLVSLKPDDGLIELTDHYTATDLSVGAVAGEKEHEKIQRGANGTAIKLRSYQYHEHSDAGRTVHPISRETVYRSEDGTGAIDTNYSYTFHPGTVQMASRTVTLPAIPAEQNGSGVSATRTDVFDLLGNRIWSRDERGYLTRHSYDAATGVLTQTIQDVDTAQVSDTPAGWTTPADGGQHVISDYEHDELGRVVQELGPQHEVDIDGVATQVRRASWTVYFDAVPGLPTVAREVRSALGYLDVGQASQPAFTLINPISITKSDADGKTLEEIQAAVPDPFQLVSDPLDQLRNLTVTQNDYVRWTTHQYTDCCLLSSTRVYHNIPSVAGSVPEPGLEGVNYNETRYGYDAQKRQNRQLSPGGTITRTVFSSVGWGSVPTAIYIGTNDTGATQSDPTGGGASGNNMVVVTERQYDNDHAGGDGLLTKQTQYVDSSTKRETKYAYDWRGRQTDIDGEQDLFIRTTFNNLDQVTGVDRYDTTASGKLVARSETQYDNLGRLCQRKRYAVDGSTGTVGNAFISKTWCDAVGNVIKEHPAGSQAFVKSVYDSLGRKIKQFVGYDSDETSYFDAGTVSGDTIFEQVERDYDITNNLTEIRLRRRHHDATGTGELTTPGSSNPKARVIYVALYSDPLGRQIAVANYGTNDHTPLLRSSAIPARSDNIRVLTKEYNDAGEEFRSIDSMGKVDRTEYDDAGRIIKFIENYTDGDPTTGGEDEDITVLFTYEADGQRTSITAKQKSSLDDQTTKYVYGTSLADSDVARSDFLRAVIYPDSDNAGATGIPPVLTNGASGVYDRVEHRYNRQGQVKETKDQNGTVHSFDFDQLGRQVHDRITALGIGVDGAVRRISTSYDVQGNVKGITSYDNAMVGSGTVVNEVFREYGDSGLLENEYQQLDGAKNANTPNVGYIYDESSNGGEFSKGLRLKSIRYPNGRLVHHTYGSSGSDSDNLNRLDAIKDDDSGLAGATLTSFDYLGAGIVVIEDLEEPDVQLDLFGGTSGTYSGLDHFNRVVDQRWYDSGASADRDRLKYGYDAASNRTYREDTVISGQDQFYTYDGVNRLKNFDHGDLNAGKTGIGASPIREEEWTLDPLGNWSGYTQKTNSTTGLNQVRSFNKANEITDIDESIGTSWPTPNYDKNGNMTSIPQPADLANSYDCTWDGWNRLVKVEDGTTTIASYGYDGLNRRISKNIGGTARYFFYSDRWQVLEERPDTSAHSDNQYIWGPLHMDHLILRDRDTSALPTGVLDERLYALQDANWNVTCLIDSTGSAVERYSYAPYGATSILDGAGTTMLTESSVGNCYTFAGMRYDAEVGLIFYRARYYQPELGRFLSRDPIEFGDGPNQYAYVHNSPLASADPTGLAATTSLGWATAPRSRWQRVATGETRPALVSTQELATMIKVEEMEKLGSKTEVTFGVTGSYKGFSAGAKQTFSYEASISWSVGQTWTIKNTYTIENEEEQYITYETQWQTYYVESGIMGVAACWMISGSPSSRWRYVKLASGTRGLFGCIVWVRCADVTTLRRTPGTPGVEEWVKTGKYRLFRDGQLLVGWTQNRNFINAKLHEDHEQEVEASMNRAP